MGPALKVLALCMALAACATPSPIDDPRQVWCDHNRPRRPSAAIIAAMTRSELDEVNVHNGKGARWCGWTP